MGTLYLVATPIGNLEDISLRALRVLREAGLVAAEDTRQTHKLLERYDIHARMLSYHEHNKLSRLDEVLQALAMGDVALVSDAGTPGLNDPGYELVRAALDAGYAVSPVPGPSAPISALVTSGLPTDQFLYLGYLPRRSIERRYLLKTVVDLPYTLIFLETPHRLVDALADLLFILGDRPCAAARELTKLHEEIIRGTIGSVQSHFEVEQPRGEFTLVVGGASKVVATWEEERVRSALREGQAAGEAPGSLVDRIGKASGWRKKVVYRWLVDLKRED
jgi:16S rRNA (cytidine1402-2'-O)-methyltransferase